MIAVKRELVQAVLDYLQEQPYKNVAGLINELMQSKPVPEIKPKESEE